MDRRRDQDRRRGGGCGEVHRQVLTGGRSRSECVAVSLPMIITLLSPRVPQQITYLSQRGGHPVEELCREDCRLPAAGLVDDSLTAGQVRLEAAAEGGHLLVRGPAGGLVLDQPEPGLVLSGALLVLGLDLGHAGGVPQVVRLVGPGPAEVLYHLDYPGVEDVEVVPLVGVQAPHGEGVDAGQAVHQLRTHRLELLHAGAQAQVGLVGEESEGVRAARHLVGRTVRLGKHWEHKLAGIEGLSLNYCLKMIISLGVKIKRLLSSLD